MLLLLFAAVKSLVVDKSSGVIDVDTIINETKKRM